MLESLEILPQIHLGAMAKLLLLYCVFLLSIVFVVLPDFTTERYDFFLFSDQKLTAQTYIYFLCEHLVMIILSYIIFAESKKHRGALWVFFMLMICDLVDYILGYNEVWVKLSAFPVSFNTVSVLIFGLVIINEWINSR